MKSTAAILAAAMFVGDHTTASTSLAGAAAVVQIWRTRTKSTQNGWVRTWSWKRGRNTRKLTRSCNSWRRLRMSWCGIYYAICPVRYWLHSMTQTPTRTSSPTSTLGSSTSRTHTTCPTRMTHEDPREVVSQGCAHVHMYACTVHD